MSGSGMEELKASLRKAGSPMATWPHGPMFSRLSHTSKEKDWRLYAAVSWFPKSSVSSISSSASSQSPAMSILTFLLGGSLSWRRAAPMCPPFNIKLL